MCPSGNVRKLLLDDLAYAAPFEGWKSVAEVDVDDRHLVLGLLQGVLRSDPEMYQRVGFSGHGDSKLSG